jgi:hypothetical protein
MELPNNLLKEITDYCVLNNIENVDEFIINLIKQGFTVAKYGLAPRNSKLIAPDLFETQPIIEPQVKEQKEYPSMETVKSKELNKNDIYGE